jgi:hypothetical protein
MRQIRPWREMIVDWAPELSAKLGRPVDVILERGLGALDFGASSSVEIRDPGGMTTRIDHAFALIRPKQNLAAVFSEHCGYLEFDLKEDSVVAEIREEIYTHWGDDQDEA